MHPLVHFALTHLACVELLPVRPDGRSCKNRGCEGGKGERGFIWGLRGLHVERGGSHEVERGKRGAAQPR